MTEADLNIDDFVNDLKEHLKEVVAAATNNVIDDRIRANDIAHKIVHGINLWLVITSAGRKYCAPSKIEDIFNKPCDQIRIEIDEQEKKIIFRAEVQNEKD